MKTNLFLLLIFLLTSCAKETSDAQEIPVVYNVENTGLDCTPPPLPAFEDLPNIRPLTDPFEWSDGSGRSTDFDDWRCRRAEISAEIQHYEIGMKPGKPDELEASLSPGNELTVNITHNGQTLTLTTQINLPEGEGPFPAVIGIGLGTGSLPADIFTDRGIATIAFNFGQVMSHTQTRGNEPINQLYPDLVYIGAYSAWPWGISRLIDGLEIVSEELNLDMNRLGVTGCSFAGKMALYAGAFDERIALTIAQESGGGGAAAWRVSETLGNVEVLGSTNYAWFREDLRRFANEVDKLPFDHHELMAMVAPRALLVLGNPDYEWLADESGFVSCTAAHEVWKTFGIADRFGYSIVAGHPHCQLPDGQRPEVEAFVDKFLLGDSTANTNVTIHPYANVDHERWYEWWGSGEPVFPAIDTSNIEWVFLEAECGTYGADWQVLHDEAASNEGYVTIQAGLNSTSSAPAGNTGTITIPFSVSKDTVYYLYARLNCPSAEDDSFWIKIDDGAYTLNNGLGTTGWQWVSLSSMELTTGEHTLTIAYREDGALLDKISLTDYVYGPPDVFGVSGAGGTAVNQCTPAVTASRLKGPN